MQKMKLSTCLLQRKKEQKLFSSPLLYNCVYTASYLPALLAKIFHQQVFARQDYSLHCIEYFFPFPLLYTCYMPALLQQHSIIFFLFMRGRADHRIFHLQQVLARQEMTVYRIIFFLLFLWFIYVFTRFTMCQHDDILFFYENQC